jgi:hypothetical protein
MVFLVTVLSDEIGGAMARAFCQNRGEPVRNIAWSTLFHLEKSGQGIAPFATSRSMKE